MGILCSWSMDLLVLALSVPILPQLCYCHSGRGGRSQSWAPGCECLHVRTAAPRMDRTARMVAKLLCPSSMRLRVTQRQWVTCVL